MNFHVVCNDCGEIWPFDATVNRDTDRHQCDRIRIANVERATRRASFFDGLLAVDLYRHPFTDQFCGWDRGCEAAWFDTNGRLTIDTYAREIPQDMKRLETSK